eukprot:g2471.t1
MRTGLHAITASRALKHARAQPVDDTKKKKEEQEDSRVEEETKRYRKDETNYTGFARSYILFSHKVEKVTLSDNFNIFIIVVILLAGVLVGVQTYGCSEEIKRTAKYSCYTDLHENSTVEGIDTVILIIFILEAILKMMAEGLEPWRYFTGPEWAWNNFDFIIIVLCLPIIPTGSDSTVAILRLFRLMRVMKLVGKIPQLQMIVTGLISGMNSIGYIGVLLMMVFYLYAIVGISLFGDNDPWHFRNLVVSFNTLFRMMTLEDWTDVMYINLYGCDETTLEDRFISGFYTDESLPYLPRANNASIFNCVKDTKPNEIITILFFFSFIVISALVALSLVLGAITMGMADSMEKMKEMAEEKERVAKLEKARKKKYELARHRSRSHRKYGNNKVHPEGKDISSVGSVPMSDGTGSIESGNDDGDDEGESSSFCSRVQRFLRVNEDDSHMELMQSVIRAAWDGEKISVQRLERRFSEKRRQNNDAAGGFYHMLAGQAAVVRDNEYFQNFVTLVIIAAGVVVGIEADTDVEQKEANMFILIVFIIEIIVKVIAEYNRPLRYFFHHGSFDKWNIFDFVVVAGSLIPMGSASSIVTMLRLLRLLRVLKLVKALPALQVIVEALMNGVKSIYYIGIIMFLFFYMFGILGMILFRDNDPWHFGTLHDTLLTLFRMSTLEDWTDVMYINMLGCLNYGYESFPDLCDPDLSADPDNKWRQFGVQMYCWIVVAYGGLMLVPLFIGVICSSMEEAVGRQKAEQKEMRRIDAIVNAGHIPEETIYLYLKVFEMIDVDEGGSVDLDEIKLGLSMVGVVRTDQELKSAIQAIIRDPNNADIVGDIEDDDELNKPSFVLFMNAMSSKKVDENETAQTSTTNLFVDDEDDDTEKRNKPEAHHNNAWVGGLRRSSTDKSVEL